MGAYTLKDTRYLKGSLGPPVVYLWEMKVSLQEDFTLKKWGLKGDDFWNQKSRMILSSGLHLTLESISKHWGVESESKSRSVVSDSLRPCGLYSPWTSPGQNTGVGSLSLLQGIFPTQGLNPGLLHCRWILYQLSHQGSPGTLKWVAYPFSSRSSWPRNQTWVSCIADRFFTSWATRDPVVKEEVRMMVMIMVMQHNFISICTGHVEV